MSFPYRLPGLIAGLVPLLFMPLIADDDQSTEASSVARAWVAEIDAGKYDASYMDGGSALHDKVPQDTWVKILTAERPEFGKVLSRQETTRSYQPNGFEGVDGEFMVLSYHTNFANKPDEVEHIILRREDGKWRGVGYNFGPEEVVTDPDAGPVTTTTSETNAPPISDHPIVVPAKRTKPQ
jgi:hypothetical protein